MESQQNTDQDELAAQVQAEFDAIDNHLDDDDDDTSELFRYVRLRSRYIDELKRAKEMYANIEAEINSKIRGLDWVHERSVSEIVARRLEGGKRRSIKTPFGVAGFRRQAERLNVVSRKLLMIAVENGTAPADAFVAKTETFISLTVVKQHYASTGEILPGCELIESCDKFYVK